MNRAALGSAALGVVALGFALLSGCTAEADPKTPEEQVADAVDNFASDNTGAYSLANGLSEGGTEELGFYRVTPDANATKRTFVGADGTSVVRYLRIGRSLWAELPGNETGDVRTGSCWVHGTNISVARVGALTFGNVPLSTPAVEVVLGLRKGRLEDGVLVADANLRTVATALGYPAVRRLGLTKGRVDVPVTVSVDDARITSWEASLGDIIELAPDGEAFELSAADAEATIVATFGEPGRDLDLTPPADDVVTEASAGQEGIDALPETCDV